MRLISYRKGGEAGVGVMVDDQGFVALGSAAPDLPDSLAAIIALEDGLARAGDAAAVFRQEVSLYSGHLQSSRRESLFPQAVRLAGSGN